MGEGGDGGGEADTGERVDGEKAGKGEAPSRAGRRKARAWLIPIRVIPSGEAGGEAGGAGGAARDEGCCAVLLEPSWEENDRGTRVGATGRRL